MKITGIKSTNPARKKEIYRKLSKALGGRLKTDVVLARYTTFGIGGKADLFYRATTPDQLIYTIRTAQKLNVRYLVLGGGSNILMSDSGFRGLIIKNECRNIVVNQNSITCQSGAWLDDVVKKACSSSLSGCEFAAGIPGTVGGAIRGNAGAFGKAVGDILTRAVLLTSKGEIKEVKRDFFRFGYRESILKRNGDIVLSATFGLKKRRPKEIEKQVKENIEKRRVNLPWKERSAGCYFKNIIQGKKKISTGLLLDQIGAKGMQAGGAQVSRKHANILINVKNAKSADVKKLSSILKRMIKAKFNINLKEEVVYID